MSKPDISVVVCTFNRVRLLTAALESLVAQVASDAFDYEIVVVDNGSSDGTSEMLSRIELRESPQLRAVEERRPGVAAARNRGIREARGDWIAFFDDDQLADSTWLAELYDVAELTGARCVGGAVVLLLPTRGQTVSEVCQGVLGATSAGPARRRYEGKITPGAGNMMIHRSVFELVGGFDESLVEAGEDSDLYRRIRAADIEAWYTPTAVVRHVIPARRMTDEFFRHSSLRLGASFARRDARARGKLILAGLMIARVGQALGISLPRYLWARGRRDPDQALGASCLLWRALGYAARTIDIILPERFAPGFYVDETSFRAAREAAADPSVAAPKGEETAV